MSVHPLRNPIQEYAWGSRTTLPAFLGRPVPSERPWAELWLGAHPRASSQVRVDGAWLPLRDAIEARPDYWLGSALSKGRELPFLFKMLAVERPLSLQLHPDRRAAEAGFARENAAGIPLDAPDRRYRDAHAKHEMLCALTPFHALCGLRPLARQRELLASLALPELDALAPAADADEDSAWLAVLLRLPEERRAALATAAATAAAAEAGRRDEPAFAWVAQLAEAYPGDPAALAPLVLEAVELAPGEALFLPPGEPHSYLHGTALELMDSSDNVVRGGLTPKQTDADELLALAAPRARAPEPLRATRADGEDRWPVRCDAFALSTLRVEPGAGCQRSGRDRPEILLCTRGEAQLAAAGEELVLVRGEAAFVAGTTPRYDLRGDAELYLASVPA